MAKTLTKQEHISEGVEKHGFDFRDSKGREIGAMVRQGLSIYTVPTDGEKPGAWHVAPGSYLTAYIHSTRGGNAFGASGRFKMFKIEGENGERHASKDRSLWVAGQIQDMKAKQKARNAA